MNNTDKALMETDWREADCIYFNSRSYGDESRIRFKAGYERGWKERNNTVKALQARIDALMLEYCPDEMTAEQLEEWANNQKPAGEPSDE